MRRLAKTEIPESILVLVSEFFRERPDVLRQIIKLRPEIAVELLRMPEVAEAISQNPEVLSATLTGRPEVLSAVLNALPDEVLAEVFRGVPREKLARALLRISGE